MLPLGAPVCSLHCRRCRKEGSRPSSRTQTRAYDRISCPWIGRACCHGRLLPPPSASAAVRYSTRMIASSVCDHAATMTASSASRCTLCAETADSNAMPAALMIQLMLAVMIGHDLQVHRCPARYDRRVNTKNETRLVGAVHVSVDVHKLNTLEQSRGSITFRLVDCAPRCHP